MKLNKETLKNHKISQDRAWRLRNLGYEYGDLEGILDLSQLGFDNLEERSLGGFYKKNPDNGVFNHIINDGEYIIYPLLSRYEKLLHSVFYKINGDYNLMEKIPLILLGDIEIIDEFQHEDQDKINNYQNYIITDPFGVYYPVINIIILDTEKMLRFIKEEELLIEYSIFFEKVLLHELGHWISHELSINGKIWDDVNFFKSCMDVKEFWANYLSYLMMDDKHRLFQKYLAKEYQSIPYQRYLEAINKDSVKVLKLLSQRENLNWEDLSNEIKSIGDRY